MQKMLALKDTLSKMTDDIPDVIVQAILTRFASVLDDNDALLAAVSCPKFKLQKPKALTRKDPAEAFLAMYCDSSPSVIHRDERLPKTVAELKQEIQALKEENANLRELLVQDVPELLKTMKNVIDLVETAERSSLELSTPPLPPQSSLLSRPSSSSAESLLSTSSSTSESIIPSTRDSRRSKVIDF
ncbi:uncharacterized protein V6R79_009663 [Siganus canaliculatus]